MKVRNVFMCGACLLALASCGGQKWYAEEYAPEEGALNLVKITDEANGSVLGPVFRNYLLKGLGNDSYGICKSSQIYWSTPNVLAISPDGTKLAYNAFNNKQSNIMVRSAGSQGLATQRTFRNVSDFTWGSDGNLYFSDHDGNNTFICCVNASAGSMMTQLTNGAVSDTNPSVSSDGKRVYFTRKNSSGPSIWCLDRESGALTLCARGFNPCTIKDNPDAFYCVRNNSQGRSEIWYINYVKGEESVVLSDINRSFTNPALSPDGKWIACVGNSKSNITKKDNLDIFVVRTNGTSLTQLTYHPDTDASPAWAGDGRSIYFLSTRANKAQAFNVWRMNFNMQ